jgi:diacylglycerol kinase
MIFVKTYTLKKKNTFIHAAGGISYAFRNEANFRVHVLAMALAVAMGVALQISAMEWLFVAGCCMLVLSMELMNTAIENVCNLVSGEYHPLIKIVKDVAAAAVLVSAIGSSVGGGIIFIPKIIHQLKYLLC